jgi:hypothetical protein
MIKFDNRKRVIVKYLWWFKTLEGITKWPFQWAAIVQEQDGKKDWHDIRFTETHKLGLINRIRAFLWFCGNPYNFAL